MSPKKRKRSPSTCKLPYVPRVIFSNNSEPFTTLTRSILESRQYENALNNGARQMKRKFRKDRIPDMVFVVESADLDVSHKFSQYDPEFEDETYGREDYCIQLSLKLMNYIRSHPHNKELILLACVVTVHEISHVILRTGLNLRETPEKFDNDNFVFDFGFFVERMLFKQIKLFSFGLNLYSAQWGWFDNNCDYDDAYLGTDPKRKYILSKDYVNSIVDTRTWRAIKRSDIVRSHFGNRHLVCRSNGGIGEMRNVRGYCGTGTM